MVIVNTTIDLDLYYPTISQMTNKNLLYKINNKMKPMLTFIIDYDNLVRLEKKSTFFRTQAVIFK